MIAIVSILAAMTTFGLAAIATAPAAADPGVWPVDHARILVAFDPPARDWQPGHRGVDLAAGPGQQIRAMASGVVAFTGAVGAKPVVVIRLPDGRRLTYEPVLGRAAVGTRVQAGEPIGVLAGAGGHCGTRGCLHVGLRTPGGYADPLVLVGRRPAVLKPLRSGPRVRLGEGGPQPLDRDVRVALGRSERGMAE